MKFALSIFLIIILAGCDKRDDTTTSASKTTSSSNSTRSIWEGSPNVANVVIDQSIIGNASTITFIVESKADAVAQPWSKTLNVRTLERTTNGNYIVPISGLYLNYINRIEFFIKGVFVGVVRITTRALSELFATDLPFDDVTKTISPTVANKPNFSYFKISSSLGGTIIYDIDGEIRWMPEAADTSLTYLSNYLSPPLDQLLSFSSNKVIEYNFDGTGIESQILARYVNITALLAPSRVSPFNTNAFVPINGIRASDGVTTNKSVILELDPNGTQVGYWDFEEILTRHMFSSGEDATLLIGNNPNWFELNSVTIDHINNFVIASSREHFVIAVGYEDKEIKWILGDNSKYWGSFTSLLNFALDLNGKVPPVGQHSLSITREGNLLLFNNGENSFSYADAGIRLSSSRVSEYEIDRAKLTADIVFNYDDTTLFSPLCSSVDENYLAEDGSTHYLIIYSVEGSSPAQTIFRVIDSDKNVLLNYILPTNVNDCTTAASGNILPDLVN